MALMRSAIFVAAACLPMGALADWFGSGENRFEIAFVTVGSPGNVADTTGAPNPAGSVGYVYRIGKFEVPEEAVRKANAQSELDGEPLGLTLDERGPQKPATRLSWFEAARFVNWLNEDRGATPAYKFDTAGEFQLWAPGDAGYNPANPFRNALARYFLPSVDEWYKAAFYDPAIDGYWDFPTGSNDPPTPVASGNDPGTAVYEQAGPANVSLAGGASPFGTVGQAGNVWEWEETAVDLINDEVLETRGLRGYAWLSISGDPIGLSSGFRHSIIGPGRPTADSGFRLAAVVPEPATVAAFFLILTMFPIRERNAS